MRRPRQWLFANLGGHVSIFTAGAAGRGPGDGLGVGGTAEADVLEVIRVPVVTLKQDDEGTGGSCGSEGRVWTRETEAEDSRKVIVGAAGNGDIWGEKGRDGARVWAGHRLTAFLEVAGG